MRHEEVPNIRADRVLCVAGIVAALYTSVWLVRRINADLDAVHSKEFLALSLFVVLTLYLGWRLYTLLTVRYTLTPEGISLLCGRNRLKVTRERMIHLYRWRNRWGWRGGAMADLGVEDILHLPPCMTAPKGSTWVLVYQSAQGVRRAVAIRPSIALLDRLKKFRVPEQGATDATPAVTVTAAASVETPVAIKGKASAPVEAPVSVEVTMAIEVPVPEEDCTVEEEESPSQQSDARKTRRPGKRRSKKGKRK